MSKAKGGGKQKVPEQRAQPLGRWFWGKVFALVGSNASLVVVTTGVCLCVWRVAAALEVYAGKQSNANVRFGFDLLADIRMVYTVSIAVGTTGVALYFRERRLHRKTRERLATRITDLELRIDPSRRSSKLTAEGLTREDDK
jgi:hypothetical protein